MKKLELIFLALMICVMVMSCCGIAEGGNTYMQENNDSVQQVANSVGKIVMREGFGTEEIKVMMMDGHKVISHKWYFGSSSGMQDIHIPQDCPKCNINHKE